MKKVNTSDSQKAGIRIQLELTLKNKMSLIKNQWKEIIKEWETCTCIFPDR